MIMKEGQLNGAQATGKGLEPLTTRSAHKVPLIQELWERGDPGRRRNGDRYMPLAAQ